MLAKSFQLHGLEPVAAIPADGRLPARYLELFGVRRFVRLEDYLTPELEDEARREGECCSTVCASPTTCGDSRSAASTSGGRPCRPSPATCTRAVSTSRTPRRASCSAGCCPSAVRSTLAFERLLDDVRARARALQRAQLRRPGPAQRPRARPRVERRPVRRRVRGRHARAQALHGGDEGDPPALARRRVVGARACAALGRAAGARARGGLLEALRREHVPRSPRTRAGRGRARAGEVVAELGLDPSRKTAVVFSHVLWDANMFYGRDLFADQEEWFVETVRAAAANDAVNWVDQAAPGERLEAQARRRHRRARRAGRDSQARRLATAARPRARADERRQHVVAVRRDGLRRDDPRLDRLRAAVLRRARADRRHRLLLGPRLHRRLGHRRRVPARGSRGSRTFRRPTPTRSSSPVATRTRCSGCGRRASTRSDSSTCRSTTSTIRSRRRSSSARATPEELAADLDRVGRWAVRSRELDYLEL